MPQLTTTPRQRFVELNRELKVRQDVFPRWVANDKNKLDQATADHRIACIKDSIAEMLVWYPELHDVVQTDLFDKHS